MDWQLDGGYTGTSSGMMHISQEFSDDPSVNVAEDDTKMVCKGLTQVT